SRVVVFLSNAVRLVRQVKDLTPAPRSAVRRGVGRGLDREARLDVRLLRADSPSCRLNLFRCGVGILVDQLARSTAGPGPLGPATYILPRLADGDHIHSDRPNLAWKLSKHLLRFSLHELVDFLLIHCG